MWAAFIDSPFWLQAAIIVAFANLSVLAILGLLSLPWWIEEARLWLQSEADHDAWAATVLRNLETVTPEKEQQVLAIVRRVDREPARVLPITEERKVRVQVKW